jgi:hypothetical protein
MCCFSRPVKFVSNTRIFARFAAEGRQLLAYGMRVGAPEDLAMILPIPVAAGTPDDGVKFINLVGYPKLFEALDNLFPSGDLETKSAGLPLTRSKSMLKVEEVGRFVASFVPTVRDFGRLDPRFRLPDAVWKRLGQYADYGFAVFQLKKGDGPIHPMAFEFRTAKPDRLFFPTVHIHDGAVHPVAEFDHALYAQLRKSGLFSALHWQESDGPASRAVDSSKSRNLVVADQHVLRMTITGEQPNEDTWLRAG